METPLTKKEAVRLHRILWNTIADILEEEGFSRAVILEEEGFSRAVILKNIALEKMACRGDFEGTRPFLGCFCCEYDERLNIMNEACLRHCPIIWSDSSRGCSDSEYRVFETCLADEKLPEAIEMARTIANLPERPDQDFDIL